MRAFKEAGGLQFLADQLPQYQPGWADYAHHFQGRHGEFEPGKVQYSTPKILYRLFLIGAY